MLLTATSPYAIVSGSNEFQFRKIGVTNLTTPLAGSGVTFTAQDLSVLAMTVFSPNPKTFIGPVELSTLPMSVAGP